MGKDALLVGLQFSYLVDGGTTHISLLPCRTGPCTAFNFINSDVILVKLWLSPISGSIFLCTNQKNNWFSATELPITFTLSGVPTKSETTFLTSWRRPTTAALPGKAARSVAPSFAFWRVLHSVFQDQLCQSCAKGSLWLCHCTEKASASVPETCSGIFWWDPSLKQEENSNVD